MLDRRDECRSAGCARQPAAGHPQNMAHLSADCTGQPAACRNLETDPLPSADSGKMPGICHQPGIQGWQQGQAACMYRTAE